ncbi:NAD(P)-dependent dehydrogenase (short-subunit alcohol dehydrogenase family) [Knoellia remsis]|uniref:NAD(P)-dependent dehydrogenase (Short-subunit alcohol dehydrogenase family) n=1 Tax=Knoellia remsis TaxID=407159 RepID=A0A2T0V107_9MICO|nr:SDR family oxidoreductase [Knoellia remsis]PRY63846.1 NAD(P)-dependent dehydrogenase (short-subunit alcohol dehydrogenase family) [Knoellia remsis]
MSRSVIVTGAARGIGRAVVDLLSADGVNVVGVDREDAPRDLCNDSRSTWVAGDVTNPAVMRAAMSSATARGPLTGLVVSAALQSWWSVLELDETRWRDTLDVNLVAPALWARAVATTVRSSRGDTAGTSATGASAGPGAPRGPGAFGAAIVLISSVHAQVAGTGGAAYSASKAGLEALARSLAVELGPDGIRTNVVAPGFIAVERNAARHASEQDLAQRAAENPLGRVGRPEDVAEVVRFLLDDRARHVNGAVVPVDGGQLAGLGPYDA